MGVRDDNPLHKMFEEQDNFNANFFAPLGKDFSEDEEVDFDDPDVQVAVQRTKDFSLFLIGEIDEMMRLLRYKPHRRENQRFNLASIQEELIDVFKYWLSIWRTWGFDERALEQAFWKKSLVCRQRYSQEFLMSRERIVVVDIDGCLANHKQGFINWIKRDSWGMSHAKDVLHRDTWPDGYRNTPNLGLPLAAYQNLKHAFRASGAKRSLPVIPFAVDMMKALREGGYTLAIMTSRPLDGYPAMYEDTLFWLEDNDIPFDALWFGRDKDEQLLIEGVHDKVVCAIEDNTVAIQRFVAAQVPVIIPLHGGSQEPRVMGKGVQALRIKDIAETIQLLEEVVEQHGVDDGQD